MSAAAAIPGGSAGAYVAAAYLVAFALVLAYVAIMAARLSRIERELGELDELSAGGARGEGAPGRASGSVPAREQEEVAAS